jgi:hypothetical protein
MGFKDKKARLLAKKFVMDKLNFTISQFKQQKKIYEVKRLPLGIVHKIINSVKILNTDEITINEETKPFALAFNDTMDDLITNCVLQSEQIGDSCIAIAEYIQFIDVIKNGFNETNVDKPE